MASVDISKMSPAQLNSFIVNVLKTSPNVNLRRTLLGSVTTAALGSSPTKVAFQPDRTGFIKGFWVHFKATLQNASTTAAATANHAATLTLIPSIRYRDFSATNLHDTNLMALYQLASRRLGYLPGVSSPVNTGPYGAAVNLFAGCPATLAEAASATEPTTATVEFDFYIPVVSLTRNRELAGLQWAQYEKAQAELSFELPASGTLQGSDAYVNAYGAGGTVSLSNIEIEVYQEHWFGNGMVSVGGNVVLPPLSAGVSYRIQTQPIGQTFKAGSQFYDNLDEGYTYLSYGLLYDNGGVFNPATGTDRDLDLLTLNVTGTTQVRTESPGLNQIETMRHIRAGQWMDGAYFLDFADRPIVGSKNGMYKVGITPLTVNTGGTVPATFYRTIEILQSKVN